ncbi:glycosyltransferase family 4 protein [Candidatus Woesearchaeota archaeon]|nr:glycosyltransferase family 4 protein [Candidatus Woesearchaeota archaeon]
MKILMFCPDWFPFSAGLAQSCYNTCKQMEKAGHEVRVIVAEDTGLDKKDLDVVAVPYAIRLLGRNPIVWNLWEKVRKHVQWCDVVCLFSYMYEMNSRMVWLRKKGRFDKPIVHFYRGSLESDSLKHLSPLIRFAKMAYDRTCGKLMFKDVDKVISNSGPTLLVMKKMYGVSGKKLAYVKNALFVDDYPKWSKKNKRIIFVGRLIENKGVGFFSQIIKSIPSDWKLTIVGDGPMEEDVKELAKAHNNIEMVGKVSHDKCKKIVADSDINVLPTYAEGSPRSVMEASASGVPSISFAVGDVVNTIPPGCGYAIKPYDINDFCAKLEKLIKDSELRQEMGRKSLEFARKEMDWSVVYPKIDKILMNVVKDR